MRLLTIDNNYSVVCEDRNTHGGFSHKATLLYKGRGIEEAKVAYINRTWERYRFETVLYKLAEQAGRFGKLPQPQLKMFLQICKDGWWN